ncbi:MAG: hypothetical protein Kow0090_01210 [Myxococcota bacterium]
MREKGITIALLFIWLILTGCTEEFDSASLITNLRVLSIKADYPEICPISEEMCESVDGETTFHSRITLKALVADENGVIAAPDLEWGICNLRITANAKKIDCTTGNSFELVQTPASDTAIATHIDLLKPFLAFEEPELVKEIPGGIEIDDWGVFGVGDDELAGLMNALSEDAFPVILGLKAKKGDKTRLAIKTVKLSATNNPNRNPEIEGVAIRPYVADYEDDVRDVTAFYDDETELRGDEPLVKLKTGGRYIFRVIMKEGWRQTFSVKGVEEMLEEGVLISAFGTRGRFDEYMDGGAITGPERHNYIVWNTPPVIEKEEETVTLFFVASDARGGQDWRYVLVTLVQNGDAAIQF